MSNDIDFEQFIQLLDGALASDDKNVKQALRKFLFVAAMVMGDDTEPGPFTQMMDTIDSLQQRLAQLESQMSPTTTSPFTYPQTTWTGIGTGLGTGTTGTGTSTSGSITATSPPTTGGSITTTGCTTYTNPTGNTGTITLPSSNTVGSTWTISGNAANTTTSTLWYDLDDPKTGTSIKEEIKEGLEKLAKSA